MDEPVYGRGGYVGVAPPALIVESRGLAPGPGYLWIDGYWGWNGARHVWAPGRWTAPRRGYNWVPHEWVQSERGRRLREGHWEPSRRQGKGELRRRPLELPNPDAAYPYVEGILSEKWMWAVLPHNCVSFVEGVIEAGGGDWSSYSNCPALATADSVSDRINSFYRWMESGIYGIYSVPYR